ncbi:MAG TPA: hypothetical protein VIU62_00365 [Chloroflexota bacterium]
MVALTPESTLPAREDDTFPGAVHEQSLRIDGQHLACFLLEGVGAPLLGRIADVADVRMLQAWAHGASLPDALQERRLRAAYEIVQTLRAWKLPDTIQAWFVGANPELGDASPARLFARNPGAVLDAAYSFIAA